jgi:hypothetical protein
MQYRSERKSAAFPADRPSVHKPWFVQHRQVGEAAMPVSFLSPSQRESYGQYAGDPSTQELARYFHLDDADHARIVEKRGAANRLGFALQLATVRFLGTFLEDPTAVPTAVMATLTRQLGAECVNEIETAEFRY